MESTLVPEHRRSLAKFFAKSCGPNAPVSALAGDTFVKSLKVRDKTDQVPGHRAAQERLQIARNNSAEQIICRQSKFGNVQNIL